MKDILQKAIVFFGTFLIVFPCYAVDAPKNLELITATENTLSVSWNPVEGALGYYVQFGTESGDYTMSLDSLVDGTTTTIDSLTKATNYYIVVTSIAEDVAEDGGTSDELIAQTLGGGVEQEITPMGVTDEIQEDFKLEGIEVLKYNTLKLSFNAALETGDNVEREFKISNTADEFDQLEVQKAELSKEDDSELILTLTNDAPAGVEYSLVVIALRDTLGRNLESWHDSAEVFVVPSNLEETEFEAAPVVEENLVKETPTGEELNKEDVVETIGSTADDVDALPQTGPEMILIFILTLILGTCLFVFNYKKRS